MLVAQTWGNCSVDLTPSDAVVTQIFLR